MKNKENASDNTKRKPYVMMPDKVVQNPNPGANENMSRVRTEEPRKQNQQPSYGAGSEITDGEDA